MTRQMRFRHDIQGKVELFIKRVAFREIIYFLTEVMYFFLGFASFFLLTAEEVEEVNLTLVIVGIGLEGCVEGFLDRDGVIWRFLFEA